MFRKATFKAAALAALLAMPVIGSLAHAPGAHAAGSTTITYVVNGVTKTLTVPTGTNGCTGNLVPVYGSSALKAFTLAAATADCNTAPNKATYRDVEYVSGGDSCPGDEFVSNYTGPNGIGAADVFPVSCPNNFVINPGNIGDTQLAANAVIAITPCPGANEPQGGAPNETNRFPTPQLPCTGQGSGTQTFVAANNFGSQSALPLWSTSLSDWAQAGGIANNSIFVQQRVVGSGTRITFCDNVFGPGQDASCGNNTSGLATGTSDMLNAVCGLAFGSQYGTGQPHNSGTGEIGYVTRSAVTIDPRQPNGGTQYPMPGCGLVAFNGLTSYNGTCDPSNSATFNAGNSGNNPEDGIATCNGDLQIAEGQYPAWGYVHYSVNNTTSHSDAAGFITYAVGQQALLETFGFVRGCKMLFTRSVDGGALTASAGATC